MVSAGRYAARLDPEEREPVIESAFFMALVAQGFGTISGEDFSAPLLLLDSEDRFPSIRHSGE